MTTNAKPIMKMTDEEFEQWLKWRLKDDGMRGCMKSNSYRIGFIQEVYLIDENGDIIDSGEFTDENDAEEMMREFSDRIFSEGKEEEWLIRYVKKEERHGIFYDPELTVKWKENSRQSRKNEIAKMEQKKQRYLRWGEACDWLISEGCHLKPKFNKREQVIREVAKNDLGEEFNKRYPEFKISEGELSEWQVYYKKKGGKKR